MNSVIQKICCAAFFSCWLFSLYGLDSTISYPSKEMKRDMIIARMLSEVQELRGELRQVKEILAPTKKDPVKTWKSTFWKVGYGVLLVSVPVSVGCLLYQVYSGDLADILVDQSYDSFGQQMYARIDKFSEDHKTLHSIGKYAQSIGSKVLTWSGYWSSETSQVEPATTVS